MVFIGISFLGKMNQTIYPPLDDSYFFSNFLESYLAKSGKEIKYLDMGTGGGILSRAVTKFISKKNITASDINQKAVKILKLEGFNTVKSNLFSDIKGKFDLITFNAPYLPEDPREPKDSKILTTGGKRGDEVSLRFLKKAKGHLRKNGKIFLLISSLTPRDKINKFSPKIVSRKKLFQEELLILEFSK